MSRKQIAIIGSGIVGTACAHYLARMGNQVVVIDQATRGSGCSHGNCGYISPSHILPLIAPGMISKSWTMALKAHSPLKIHLGWSLARWRWLMRFARNCSQETMQASAHARAELLNSTVTEYEQILNQDWCESEWMKAGSLFVYSKDEGMDQYGRVDQWLSREFGITAERLNGDQLSQKEPALNTGLAGGWFYEIDSHLRPDLLLNSWQEYLIAQGVTFIEHQAIQELINENYQIRAVKIHDSMIDVDEVVVACGAWTPFLRQQIGCSIPIQPGKGYSITMSRPQSCPRIPIIFQEEKVALTPMPSALRLGSMMELVGYDQGIKAERIRWLTSTAERYLKNWTSQHVEETWTGWRPMTPDDLPIIDRSPRYQNLWVAAGHGMTGLTMAPVTGKLISELIAGTKTHINSKPYAINRGSI